MKGMRTVLFFIIIIAFWQLVSQMNIWPSYIFPSPMGVLAAFLQESEGGEFAQAIIASMRRMVLGFGIALILGTVLGVMMSQIRLADEVLSPIVLGLQTLPSICWLPLAILWFGLSDKAIIFIVIIGAIWSIGMAIRSGITNVPPIFINAARTMGAKSWDLYSEVIFPAALPSIISGIRQGWSFAWRSLMAGELVFFTAGLGQLLQVGRELNDINQIVAVMIVIMAIGFLIERLIFTRLEDDMKVRWGLSSCA